MKILAIERELPGAAGEDFRPHMRAEAEKGWELYQAGVIRELYFHRDMHSAVFVLECADENEAETVLATLPLVKAGLIAFDIIPLVPYPGFSRLFSKEETRVSRRRGRR
jgi:muconolactone delta-isomerase